LEGLRKVREETARQKALELAQHRRAAHDAHESARQAGEETREGEKRIREGFTGRTSGWELKQGEIHLMDLRKRQSASENRHAEETQAAERARGRLQAAEREREAIDRLRDRRYVEFLKAVLREEQQGTDEAAAEQFRRKAA
jgi:flagellar export protein FliJ